MNKQKKKLIDQEWYRNSVTHFSVISGFLTVIGLVYGIISYHQTVKPLVDEKKLKGEIETLETHNNQLTDQTNDLKLTKTNLQNDLTELQTKKEKTQGQLEDKEKQLLDMQNEMIMAHADAYMSPIIYDLLYRSARSEKLNVKEMTLEELDNKLKNSADSKTQKDVINLLKKFTNENIKKDSDFSQLFNYKLYIYEHKLK
ncbi:hypothetical protein P8610_03350 [Fictibacillus sp. UD]|uniref:hypothetical protein n=1 Tax=Fictibacillus sp. UD TaxID=3038777 RepID=UPI00374520B6